MGGTQQIFVGRLPREMRSSELERIFEKHGKLSRCYGFIEYHEIEDAEDAIKACNGMSLQGERIVVEFAKGAARKRDDNTCFRCNQEAGSGGRRGGRSRSRSRSPRSRRQRGDRRDGSRSRRHRSRSASPGRRHSSRTRRGGDRSSGGGDRARPSRGSRRSRSRSASPHRGSGGRGNGRRGGERRSGRSASPGARGKGSKYTDRDAPQTWDRKEDSAIVDSAHEDKAGGNAFTPDHEADGANWDA
ncbi:hypothetical protein GGF37_003628 [Kickxella alabastrina]|nr:hypothetical protein GGF37_003628 [Kickxella alabastrina]